MPDTADNPSPLLKPAEVARWLQIELRTLEAYRARGDGPRCCKLAPGPTSPVRYRRQDVEQWLAEREVRRGRA